MPFNPRLSFMSHWSRRIVVSHIVFLFSVFVYAPVLLAEGSSTTSPSNLKNSFYSFFNTWRFGSQDKNVETKLNNINNEEIHPHAKVMKKMLIQYCMGCHVKIENSQTGDAEVVLGRFGDFTKAGVLRKYIAPGGIGNAEQSNLYFRVESGNMPQYYQMKPQEKEGFLAAVKDWIDSGAPELEIVKSLPPIPKEKALSYIENDLQKIQDPEYVRYISLLNVFNNNETQADTLSLVEAVSKFLNSTSWNPKIVKPITLDSKTNVILRIDIRQYGWSVNDWKVIEKAYPYANDYNDVRFDGRDIMRELRHKTQTNTPLIRADWMVSTLSLPPFYDTLIKLPQTATKLEEILQVDVKKNIQTNTLVRAGFISPGISKFNRMIERHPTRFGSYWKSYDFASPNGNLAKNISINPLGPLNIVGEGFAHDGGELIFSLPNGMQGYMLVNAQGRKIDFAPPNIVKGGLPVHKPHGIKWIEPKGTLIPTESVEEHAIVNGASCMVCHDQGMKIRPDEIGSFFSDQNNLRDSKLNARQLNQVLEQYNGITYEKSIKSDRNQFLKALQQTGAHRGEPMVLVIQNYVRDLDQKRVVAELRLSPGDLREIERNSRLTPLHQFLLQSKLGIKRNEFELQYPKLMKLILTELRNLPFDSDQEQSVSTSIAVKTTPEKTSIKKPEELKTPNPKTTPQRITLADQKKIPEKKQANPVQSKNVQNKQDKLAIKPKDQPAAKNVTSEVKSKEIEKSKLSKEKQKTQNNDQPDKQAKRGNHLVLALCARFEDKSSQEQCKNLAAQGTYQANAVRFCAKTRTAAFALRCLHNIQNRNIPQSKFAECDQIGSDPGGSIGAKTGVAISEQIKFSIECL